MSRRLVQRNALLLMAAQVVSKGAGLVALVVLANYLGAELFGKYAFALAFTTLFVPLLDFGMDVFSVREMARDPAKVPAFLGAMLLLKGLLAGAVVLLMAWTAARLGYPAITRTLVLLAGWITVVRTYTNSYVSVFRAHQKMEYEAFVLTAGKLLEAAAAVAGVWLLWSIVSVMQWTLASCFVIFGAAAWITLKRFARPVVRIDRALWARLLKGGLPFTLTGVFVMVYFKINNVLLSKMVGDKAVGLFDSATNLIYPLTVISAAIVTALFPAVSKHFHSSREEAVAGYRQAVKLSVLTAVPLALSIFVLADPIYRLLYKPEFHEAGRALRILSFLLPVIFMTNVFGNTLQAVDRQNLVFAVSVLNAAVNVVLNVLLIPRWGYCGSAVATVLTELLGFGLLSRFLKKHFADVPLFVPIGKALLYSLALVPVLALKNRLPLLGLAPLAAAAYGFVLLLFREITPGSIRNALPRASGGKDGS